MVLAAALHHSRDFGPVTYNALRSQKTARAEATNYAPRSQRHSVARDTEFFSLYEEELSGGRPSPLVEVRPQDWVKRHTVEHIIDVPYVQILDAPVPQMVDSVTDALRRVDPKISCSSCPYRAIFREPQMVGQLEKVPRILYFLKQKVDIPVPRRGGVGGLPGLRPGQSSIAAASENVVTPVPRRGASWWSSRFLSGSGLRIDFFSSSRGCW